MSINLVQESLFTYAPALITQTLKSELKPAHLEQVINRGAIKTKRDLLKAVFDQAMGHIKESFK